MDPARGSGTNFMVGYADKQAWESQRSVGPESEYPRDGIRGWGRMPGRGNCVPAPPASHLL